jgi:hypothetical protein
MVFHMCIPASASASARELAAAGKNATTKRTRLAGDPLELTCDKCGIYDPDDIRDGPVRRETEPGRLNPLFLKDPATTCAAACGFATRSDSGEPSSAELRQEWPSLAPQRWAQ